MKEIAFFDFDGTITKKDTLLEFIKFTKGRFHFYLGFLAYSPYLVAFKLKIISNQAAKEKVLAFFYKKMPVQAFEEQCDAFVENKLPTLIRSGALKEIKQLQDKGIEVVVVSASPENWIRPWTKSMNMCLLATRLEVKNELLTGKIIEHNCHGDEKVRRIQEQYILSDYKEIYAYGDSSGDKPMLAIATIKFYKPFR